MTKQVIPKYTFAPGAAGAGTITLPDFTTIDLGRLLLVVNNTRGVVLYNLTDPFKTASIAGNVITLGFSTVGHNASDKLSIIYDIQKDEPDYNRATHINSFTRMFKDDFDVAPLDITTKWTSTAIGTGASIGLTGSLLRFTSGTTANAGYRLTSKQGFRLPFRLGVIVQASQRILNCAMGIQVRNAAGDSFARYEWNLGSANAITYTTQHRGTGSGVGSTTTASIVSNPQMFEMDANAEIVDFMYRGIADQFTSTNPTTLLGTRNRGIPDPGEDYFVEFYILNGSTAPVSSSTFDIDVVLLQEFHRTEVEIYGGRGLTNASRGTPVQITNGLSLNGSSTHIGQFGADGIWYNSSTTTLAANGIFTGTSRDLVGQGTGVFGPSTQGTLKEYRVSAASDVGGTLYIEVSSDGTTWRRIKSVAMAQATGLSMSYYAEIIHRPSNRYVRAYYNNGTTGQANFSLNEMQVAV